MKYPFKHRPFDHQLEALEAGWKEREYAFFMEMGTGKTKVAIDNTCMLYDSGKVHTGVVIAPKGVYRNWTDKELPEHLPAHLADGRRVVWSSSLTQAKKKEINTLFEPHSDLSWFVINIDAVITKKGYAVLEKLLTSRECMLIVDESTIIKNPKAQRTRQMIKLGKLARYRRILTGSPVTKSPLDIFSQAEFLNPALLGFSSYYSFRRRYAVLQRRDFGGRTFDQVVSYQNVEELKGILKEFSFRKTKDECLDLPPKIYMPLRPVEMTKEQKDAYNDMRRTAMVFIEDNEATASAVITQLLRLHQIACGHLTMDDGTLLEFKHNRVEALLEILDEVEGKAIIWANYRYDIKSIAAALEKEYGKDSFVTFYGDTSEEDRAYAKKAFQDMDSPVRWFLGNTQTGGYGNTLTAARTVIYYSNNYDLEKRVQSEDRAHRIGQDASVTYVDLVCEGTVDQKIISALRSKNNIARLVTGDKWKEWI
jgi:SNF2 family DNA or RNA helicase